MSSLTTMSGDKILQIVGDRDILALGSTQEVLHHRVAIPHALEEHYASV